MSSTTRSGRCRTALATATILTFLLASCGDGDDGSSDDPTPSGSTSGSTEPSGATQTAEPTETTGPASGKAVETTYFTAHAPEGWRVEETIPDFSIVAFGPEDSSFMSWAIVETFGNQFTLDELARRSLDQGRWVTPPDLQPETVLGGQPAYHLSGPVGDGLRADVYGVLYANRQIVLDIETELAAEEHQELVDSVLATWQWK